MIMRVVLCRVDGGTHLGLRPQCFPGVGAFRPPRKWNNFSIQMLSGQDEAQKTFA
jgi:hypothetical protein